MSLRWPAGTFEGDLFILEDAFSALWDGRIDRTRLDRIVATCRRDSYEAFLEASRHRPYVSPLRKPPDVRP